MLPERDPVDQPPQRDEALADIAQFKAAAARLQADVDAPRRHWQATMRPLKQAMARLQQDVAPFQNAIAQLECDHAYRQYAWERGLRRIGLRVLDALLERARRPRRGKRKGDGRVLTDPRFVQQLHDAILVEQRATGRRLVDPRKIIGRLPVEKSAFYEYVKRATGLRWAEIRANYAELNGKRLVENREEPTEQ